MLSLVAVCLPWHTVRKNNLINFSFIIIVYTHSLIMIDYRVMRSDRGYMCMNEVDLPSPLAPGMAGLLRYKMSPKTYRDMVLQGHRFTAQQALDGELVDIICPGNEVLPKAKELALKWAPKAKSGIVYKQLKDEVKKKKIRIFLCININSNSSTIIRCTLILLDF